MALSEHWINHITAWQNSGLSQVDYCRQHQLVKGTFSARLCEFRAQATRPVAKAPVLLPIQVQPPALPRMRLTLPLCGLRPILFKRVNHFWCQRQQFIDTAIWPGGQFL